MDAIPPPFISILVLFPNLQLHVTRPLIAYDVPIDTFKYFSPNWCPARTIQHTFFVWLKVILEELRVS